MNWLRQLRCLNFVSKCGLGLPSAAIYSVFYWKALFENLSDCRLGLEYDKQIQSSKCHVDCYLRSLYKLTFECLPPGFRLNIFREWQLWCWQAFSIMSTSCQSPEEEKAQLKAENMLSGRYRWCRDVTWWLFFNLMELFQPCVYRFHCHALNRCSNSGLTVRSTLACIDSASAW